MMPDEERELLKSLPKWVYKLVNARKKIDSAFQEGEIVVLTTISQSAETILP